MKLSAIIQKAETKIMMLLFAMASLVACDNVIYDDEGDCSVTYRLKFRYDMNMKFADAFPHEVKSVSLYAFTPDGDLVGKQSEQGESLADNDYYMTLELAPGDYKLVAWCGLDNGESFTVSPMEFGKAKADMDCKLNRKQDEKGKAYSDEELHALFYGQLDVSLPGDETPGVHTYTMPLMKNTNDIVVMLQHLSGESVNPDDFTFSVEDDNNGWLDSDNNLLPDEPINYKAWNTYSGEAGGDNGTTAVRVALAELSVSQLKVGHKPMLVIRNDNGETVVRIPFIDYALLVKGKYGREMSDQEYLDRQDYYQFTFFLDEGNRWMNTYILINSYRVVLSSEDL